MGSRVKMASRRPFSLHDLCRHLVNFGGPNVRFVLLSSNHDGLHALILSVEVIRLNRHSSVSHYILACHKRMTIWTYVLVYCNANSCWTEDRNQKALYAKLRQHTLSARIITGNDFCSVLVVRAGGNKYRTCGRAKRNPGSAI